MIEVKISGEPELFEKLKKTAKEYLENATANLNYSAIAKAFWIKSQIELLNLDLREAQRLLNHAQFIAEDKALKKMAIRISTDHDELLEQLDKWETIVKNSTEIDQALSGEILQDLVAYKIKKRVRKLPKIQDEEPIMFMILSESGIPVYSTNFETKNVFDELLIGGFLTAVNSFMKITFSLTDSIERIKHKEYTIIIKTQEPLMFCYAFKGQSYHALQKINYLQDKMVHVISNWDFLEEMLQLGHTFTKKEREKISILVNEIFLEGKILQETEEINSIVLSNYEIEDIEGVGNRAKALRDAGFTSVRQVALSTANEMCKIKGIGEVNAKRIISNALDLLIKERL